MENLSKRLHLKAEIVKHLDLASNSFVKNETSSAVKVILLGVAHGAHLRGNDEEAQLSLEMAKILMDQ